MVFGNCVACPLNFPYFSLYTRLITEKMNAFAGRLENGTDDKSMPADPGCVSTECAELAVFPRPERCRCRRRLEVAIELEHRKIGKCSLENADSGTGAFQSDCLGRSHLCHNGDRQRSKPHDADRPGKSPWAFRTICPGNRGGSIAWTAPAAKSCGRRLLRKPSPE